MWYQKNFPKKYNFMLLVWNKLSLKNNLQFCNEKRIRVVKWGWSLILNLPGHRLSHLEKGWKKSRGEGNREPGHRLILNRVAKLVPRPPPPLQSLPAAPGPLHTVLIKMTTSPIKPNHSLWGIHLLALRTEDWYAAAIEDPSVVFI